MLQITDRKEQSNERSRIILSAFCLHLSSDKSMRWKDERENRYPRQGNKKKTKKMNRVPAC